MYRRRQDQGGNRFLARLSGTGLPVVSPIGGERRWTLGAISEDHVMMA